MQRIRLISQTIRVLLVVAFLLQCAIWFYFSLINVDEQRHRTTREDVEIYVTSHFEGMEVTARQLMQREFNAHLWLSTPKTILHLVLYFLLFRLFTQFYRGSIFSTSVSRQIRQLGLWVVFWPVLLIVYPPLLIGTLRVAGVIDHGELEIALGTDQMSTLVAGVMISVIGWIMEEASWLKQEQELTI